MSIFKVLENKVSKEDFIRKSYVELYSAIDAPESIDKVKFSDVSTETAQLVKQYNTYDITYALEIGYDHTEQYIDEEKYYDRELKQYITRAVVKNRTVTNWMPHQGSAENLRCTAVGCFKTGDDIDIGDKEEKISQQYENYAFDVETILKGAQSRDASEQEACQMITPSERDHLDLACASAGDTVFRKMVHLPGDRQRYFKSKWNATSMLATVFAVDRYKLAFDYNGHKCFIKQFATEETPHIYCSYKYVDDVDEEIKKAEKDQLNTNPEFQRNVKIYKAGTIGSIALILISLIVSQYLGIAAILGIVLGIVGFAVSYKFGKRMKAVGEAIHEEYKNKRNEHKNELQSRKMELLEARFSSMGLAALTAAEKERFMPQNIHRLTDLFADPSEYEDSDDDFEEPIPEPEVSWEQ